LPTYPTSQCQLSSWVGQVANLPYKPMSTLKLGGTSCQLALQAKVNSQAVWDKLPTCPTSQCQLSSCVGQVANLPYKPMPTLKLGGASCQLALQANVNSQAVWDNLPTCPTSQWQLTSCVGQLANLPYKPMATLKLGGTSCQLALQANVNSQAAMEVRPFIAATVSTSFGKVSNSSAGPLALGL